MRVTNKMLANNFLTDMQVNLNKLKTLDGQMTSGKNFRKPSDDPFNVARAMQMHSAIDANKQYNKNITNTINWLDTTDTALGQLGNVIQAVKEKLVSAGNAAYGSDERMKIKDEFNQRIGQVGQILNTNFDGEYIFGGTKGASKPINGTQDYIVTKSNVEAGDISVIGNPTEASNTNYTVKITGIDKNSGKVTNVEYSTDNGTSWTAATPAVEPPDNFKIGSFQIKAGQNLNTKTGDTYRFSLVKNTTLKYADDMGGELKPLQQIQSQFVTVSNWSGKKIGFNINGEDAEITLGNFPTTPPATVGDLVSDINKKINELSKGTPPANILQGKVMAEKTADGKIKFLNLNNDTVTIKNTDLPASEFNADLKNKLIPNIQMDMIASKRQTEISQGVLVDYNVSASEVLKYGDTEKDDIRNLLSRIVNHLDGKDDTGALNESVATKALTNEDLKDIEEAMKQILKVRSEVGAKEIRMDNAKEQNIEINFNMTEILSKTEDVDYAEKSMEVATMQSVYLAALQTSAKVLQPTLMDYLR